MEGYRLGRGFHNEAGIVSELDELRARLVESLRPFCAEPESAVTHLEEFWERHDRTTADFSESEERWVKAFREKKIASDELRRLGWKL